MMIKQIGYWCPSYKSILVILYILSVFISSGICIATNAFKSIEINLIRFINENT